MADIAEIPSVFIAVEAEAPLLAWFKQPNQRRRCKQIMELNCLCCKALAFLLL